MAEPFVGEIRLFSFPSIPRGWLPCNGQLLAIQQNQALFAILGTSYGGNGTTTFQLPDLRGRTPIHVNYGDTTVPAAALGQSAGEAAHTLLTAEMPAHTHFAAGATGTSATLVSDPAGGSWAAGSTQNLFAATADATTLAPGALSSVGGSQPHNNQQPALTLNYCIATSGIFPSRG